MRTVLITSAAYAAPEIAAEFGRLPPALLPLGSVRLFQHQVAEVASWNADRVCLTLPSDFALQHIDRDWLRSHNVEILHIPSGLGLGQSIRYALALLGEIDAELRIMHGDTLISGVDAELNDVVSVAPRPDGYEWGVSPAHGAGKSEADDVLTGYFAFRSSAAFSHAITLASESFVDALERYAADHGMSQVRIGKWLDFGHLQTYHQSRRTVSTERVFNTLSITNSTVTKTSADRAKMQFEAAWFDSIPARLKPFTARLLSTQSNGRAFSYTTEYEIAPTLSELYSLGALERPTWMLIRAACEESLRACQAEASGAAGNDILLSLGPDKARARLEQAVEATQLPADIRLNGRHYPSASQVLEICRDVIARSTGVRQSPMHGDFCFSNILYDARQRRIRLIDPRGSIDGRTQTHLGDSRYDLAKAAHSIWGLYDLIIAGRYRLDWAGGQRMDLSFEDDAQRAIVQDAFGDMRAAGVNVQDPVIWATMVTLFLAMIPLHADRPDRQAAFYANAFRVFGELERRV